MPFITFASSASLFLTSASGLILSWMYWSSDRAWTIGHHHTTSPTSPSPPSWHTSILEQIGTDGGDDSTSRDALESFLTMHYQFSALCLVLCSALLFLVVFLAPANRALNMCVHTALTLWMALFGYFMRPFGQTSLHKNLFYMLLAINVFGAGLYAVYLHMSDPRRRVAAVAGTATSTDTGTGGAPKTRPSKADDATTAAAAAAAATEKTRLDGGEAVKDK